MKDIDELEKMTVWDIVTNEGVLTQFVLGILMIAMGTVYAMLSIYFKLYFSIRRR